MRRRSDVLNGRLGAHCGLCGGALDFTLSVPHPMAATIGHLWPRYLGGTVARHNVQPEHLLCNNAASVWRDRENMYCRSFFKRFLTFALGDSGGLGRALVKRVALPFGTPHNPARSRR